MKLKAAIIGLGRMGAEPTSRFKGMLPNGWEPVSHAESIISVPALELAALCDVDSDKVRHFSQLYGVKAGYTDFRKLIDEAKPDIVSIATRTDVKADIIRYALGHGVKGFYVEKPLARSIQECEQLLHEIREADAHIVYGAQRRAMHIYKEAKNICRSGAYGEIRHITFEYGRQMLLWGHPHTADLLVFFTDASPLRYVSALCTFDGEVPRDTKLIDSDPWVENAFICLENGITANITQNEGNNVRIHLTDAIITINGDGYSIDINTSDAIKGKFHKQDRLMSKPDRSGTQELFADLADAVLRATTVTNISPHEILAGTKILVGIAQSAAHHGLKIASDEIPKDLVITGRFGNLYA